MVDMLTVTLPAHADHRDCPYGGHDCAWWPAPVDREALAEHLDAEHFDVVGFRDLDVQLG